MARTFNGNIWGGIGDKVARDAMLRREENREALGGLLDMAKFLEKANANRNLREGWQKYFEDRQAAADAAAAQGVEDSSVVEPNAIDLYGLNLFGIKNDEPVQSIFLDPSEIANGYSVAAGDSDADFMDSDDYFMANFDPNTASPEEIVRAQQIIGTNPDGIWGKKSRAALKAWRG